MHLRIVDAFVARFGARCREVRLQLFALNFFASFADAFSLHEYSDVHYGGRRAVPLLLTGTAVTYPSHEILKSRRGTRSFAFESKHDSFNTPRRLEPNERSDCSQPYVIELFCSNNIELA